MRTTHSPEARRAASLHGQAHRSDPFAGRRMLSHLGRLRPLDDAKEVTKDAQRLLPKKDAQ